MRRSVRKKDTRTLAERVEETREAVEQARYEWESIGSSLDWCESELSELADMLTQDEDEDEAADEAG